MSVECEFLETEYERHVNCRKMNEAAGFRCAMLKTYCSACDNAGGAPKPIDETHALRSSFVGFLKSRLISGDCPRYQGANPINLIEAFSKLEALVERKELERVYEMALDRWASIPEAEGGHDPDTFADRAQAVADTFQMQDVLDNWIAEHSGP